MLPIFAETFPDSPPALAEALTRGLGKYSVPTTGVRVEGAQLSALDALEIDLTGARITRDFRLPSAPASVAVAIHTQRLAVQGSPLYFENAPLDFALEATDAALILTGEPRDGALALTRAAAGSLTLAVARVALEALAHALAVQAAGKQGIEIAKTELNFQSTGPRSVSFRADVTAKVFMMSAKVSLSGKLDVDEQLNARLSGLALGGDGMITKIAGGFIQPQLAKLEGRVIPLLALAPAGLALRDLELSAGEKLEVCARFGGA